MNEIRLGTIGSGFIVRTILNCVQQVPNIRLVAVYSRSAQTGRELAAEFGAQKVYTDMDAFLQDEDINFVYVASPNILHYEQTKKALLAGKNVICEKPFCPKAEQVRELVALAKEKGLCLIDAVPPSFMPNFELVKQLLPQLGPIRLVMSNFSQYSSRYNSLLAGEMPNIFNPAFAGGCLMDINFYNIYFNVAFFGKPKKVQYFPTLHKGVADISGVAILEYEGFQSMAAGAKDTWGENFFQIEGEKGYIYIRDGSCALTEVTLVTKEGTQKFNLQDLPDRWIYEVQGIVPMVLENRTEEMERRLALTVDVIETLEQARLSAGLRFPCD